VLPSVGLTLAHAIHLQDSLSREWGKPLGLADKHYFLTRIFPGFIIGQPFQATVAQIVSELERAINPGGG
jgi:hypothetical protein